MSQVTKEDLDDLKHDIKEHIDLKFEALPCIAHAEKIENVEKIWPEIRALQTWRDGLIKIWAFVTISFSVLIAYLGLKHR